MNIKSSFIKNTTYLIAGAGLSHLILLSASPILTRIYEPSSFGVLAVFISLLSILNSIGAIGLEKSIPYIKSPLVYKFTLILCEVILYLITIILLLLVLVLPSSFYDLMKIEIIYPYRFLLPVGFLLVSRFNVFNFVGIRFTFFKELSRVKLAQALSCVFIQIISGVTFYSTIGLIIGHVFGQFVGTKLISKKIKYIFDWNQIVIAWKLKFKLAKKHYRYLSYGFFQSILNSVGQNVTMLMIAQFYGALEAGLFLLSKQTIQKPQGLIGNAIKNVFMAKVNEKNTTNKKLFILNFKLSSAIFLVGLLPVSLFCYYSTDIFGLIFGAEWEKAGAISQSIVWWMFFGLINIPSQVLVPTLKLQKSFFLYELVLTICRLVLIFSLAHSFSFESVIKYFSYLGIGFNLFFVCYILMITKKLGKI